MSHYGAMAAPLTELVKKNAFVWSDEATTAFQDLKKAVTQPRVLRLLDFSKEFTTECNAYGKGRGLCL